MNAIEKQTVVVTGASSGIGQACVARMIATGWRVFATVRKSEDGNRLKSEFGADLAPVIMDVTDRATVSAGAEQVSSALNGSGLDGLVNVAGIGMMRPIEDAKPGDLREIFEINVFGQLAVTQAFLPLIRKSHGRIVNISSVGAHIAVPFGSPINRTAARRAPAGPPGAGPAAAKPPAPDRRPPPKGPLRCAEGERRAAEPPPIADRRPPTAAQRPPPSARRPALFPRLRGREGFLYRPRRPPPAPKRRSPSRRQTAAKAPPKRRQTAAEPSPAAFYPPPLP